MKSLKVSYAPLISGLLATAFLFASGITLAQEAEEVRFSRPLAIPNAPFYLSCVVGLFAPRPAVHHWKVHLRASGIVNTELLLETWASAEERGAIKASIRDEVGENEVLVRPEPDEKRKEAIPLSLEGGRIYDLFLERVDPIQGGPSVRHYRLGSPDRRLALGWSGPLRYMEPLSAWAFHTDPGETVAVEISADPPLETGAPQVLEMLVAVTRPDGSVVLPQERLSQFPAELSIPDSPGETLIIHLSANGHFKLQKTSGTDQGFYAWPCPWTESDSSAQFPAILPPLEGEPGQNVPFQGGSPGLNGGSDDGFNLAALVGAVGGFFALAILLTVAWRWTTRRPMITATGGPFSRLTPKKAYPSSQLPSQAAIDALTPREREVLALLGRGLTNRQIGERLVITEGTAKRHVENILQKLGVISRTQAAALALQHGLAQDVESEAPPPLDQSR